MHTNRYATTRGKPGPVASHMRGATAAKKNADGSTISIHTQEAELRSDKGPHMIRPHNQKEFLEGHTWYARIAIPGQQGESGHGQEHVIPQLAEAPKHEVTAAPFAG